MGDKWETKWEKMMGVKVGDKVRKKATKCLRASWAPIAPGKTQQNADQQTGH